MGACMDRKAIAMGCMFTFCSSVSYRPALMHNFGVQTLGPCSPLHVFSYYTLAISL